MVILDAYIYASERRLFAEVVDLTVHGISFKSEQVVPVGSRVVIKLDGNKDIRNC